VNAPLVDLTQGPPRSPRVRLGGLVFLARTIDKARAILHGKQGLYKISPGLSGYLLEWLGIDEPAFIDAVARARTDDEVVAWVRAHSDPATYDEINRRLETRAIRDEQHRADVLPRYPWLGERPELRNWFKILELDDAKLFAKPSADRVTP
jgi:hypothetical protein